MLVVRRIATTSGNTPSTRVLVRLQVGNSEPLECAAVDKNARLWCRTIELLEAGTRNVSLRRVSGAR